MKQTKQHQQHQQNLLNQHHSKKGVSKKRLDQLINDNYGLLVSQAISFNPKNKYDLDDYIQTGCIGMIKGINTFDANKGKLSTYLCVCIKNEIIHYLKSEQQNRKHILNSNYVEYLSKSKINVDIIYNMWWEMLPDNITQIEKTVIGLKLDGYKRKEIAKKIDMTENQVRYIIHKLLKKIRETSE